jgi:hypothetical protein
MNRVGAVRIALHLANAGAALPLAAFFAFVGYYKAFAPLAELAKHSAFTVHLPELLGRSIGWIEIACALALVAGIVWHRAGPAQIAAALFQIAEQGVSAWIHARHGEAAMLSQNALLAVLLLTIALTRLALRRTHTQTI